MIQLIDKKRRGESHTEGEIHTLVNGVMTGSLTDYQTAAWLMAACIQGLNLDETTWLTDAFVRSGQVLDFSGLPGVVVDKHSTGGVGDKTTLVVLPLLAASGLQVAKLSGRGLGFTGGTIDKLEAIPGFRASLSTAEFLHQIQSIGMAISSQTDDLAPADGKFYALRDVTATVNSIPLIAASVVSKKIAAGAPIIVLDIKVGRGAFMKTLAEARQLAETCQAVGRRLGRNIATVISDMDQPLGYAVGHSVEIVETMATLKGEGPADLEALSLTLGAVALVKAGRVPTVEAGRSVLKGHLADGSALAKFRQLVQAQGGDLEALDNPSHLPQPDRIAMVPAPCAGYVSDIDPLVVAEVAKLVGAGRLTKESPIDLGVGVVLHKKVGDAVEKGETLVELHAGEKGFAEAMACLKQAFRFSEDPPQPPVLIQDLLLDSEPVSV